MFDTYDALIARLTARGHDIDAIDPGALAVAAIPATAADLGSLPGLWVKVYDREELLNTLVQVVEAGVLEEAIRR